MTDGLWTAWNRGVPRSRLFLWISLGPLHRAPLSPAYRILIVDWDVHHGQGIQFIFDQDPRYSPHLSLSTGFVTTSNQQARPQGLGSHSHSVVLEPGSVLLPCGLLSPNFTLKRELWRSHFTDGQTTLQVTVSGRAVKSVGFDLVLGHLVQQFTPEQL